MPVNGHCNCGSIIVTLPKLPEHCSLCYCDNCRRAGGPASANLLVEKKDLTINDQEGSLKNYEDTNTASGNKITRQFCGTCGSPVVTVVSGEDTVFLKASLFDEIPPPDKEVFSAKKHAWLKSIDGSSMS